MLHDFYKEMGQCLFFSNWCSWYGTFLQKYCYLHILEYMALLGALWPLF